MATSPVAVTALASPTPARTLSRRSATATVAPTPALAEEPEMEPAMTRAEEALSASTRRLSASSFSPRVSAAFLPTSARTSFSVSSSATVPASAAWLDAPACTVPETAST